MNRWTGTGHLTKDPKFLETESGTAICTLRIAVKRAGKQGQDGYFDVKCFDAQAYACAQYLKAGREVADRRPPALRRVPDPGRQLRLAGLRHRRARRVPRQPQAAPTVRPATRPRPNSPPRTARRARPTRPPDHHRGPAAQHRPRARRLLTVTAMTTTTTTRHETASPVPRRARRHRRDRGELLELRYRLDDGQRMGQVFDRPTGVRGLATRAIALGRRTDVYVGCAPRTRRHGGRDAVERAFVLWADCDGEDAVAALARLRAGAVDRDRLRHRQQLPRLLAADRAARRATRSSAPTGGSRTRSAPTPRPRTPPGSSASRRPSRTSTSRRPRSTRSGSTSTAASAPPTSSARCPTRRAPPRDADDRARRSRGDDPLLAIAPDVYVRRLLGVEVPRHRKVPLPVPRRPACKPACLRDRGARLVLLRRLPPRRHDLRPRRPLYGYTARGEDFLRLRAELRRLFGLEAA